MVGTIFGKAAGSLPRLGRKNLVILHNSLFFTGYDKGNIAQAWKKSKENANVLMCGFKLYNARKIVSTL
jgi:hypothetical protein